MPTRTHKGFIQEEAMKETKKSTSAGTGRRRKAGADKEGETYKLRIYVTGQTPNCVAAFGNLKRICDEHLKGKYQIEVIDLLENPKLAAGDQILAIPTLVRKLPPPLKKVIGNLSNTNRVLVGLDLFPSR